MADQTRDGGIAGTLKGPARLSRAPWPDPAPGSTGPAVAIPPDIHAAARLLVYLGHLLRKARPDPEPGSRYRVGAVVLNLTGHGTTGQQMDWPKADLMLTVGPREWNLGECSAADTRAEIEAGRLGRCVLPWLALRHGADDPAIINRWRAAALAEPAGRRRGEYAVLARVFAEAAGRKDLGKKEPEGFDMRESEIVKEWQAEGEARGEARGRVQGRRRRWCGCWKCGSGRYRRRCDSRSKRSRTLPGSKAGCPGR
jgi:hypothetical protein